LFDSLKQVVREPLIQFLLIGSCIYGLYALSAGNEVNDNERVLIVSAGEIQALTDQWTQLWKRPPTSEELAGVVRNHVRTQILYREAESMGLADGDIVIQRRLAQKVELLAQGLATPRDPADNELKVWYGKHPERFKQADLYSITHIFFDPDKRGETTLDDARVALDELRALDASPATLDNYGDRFMLQNYYPGRSELELRKLFGSGFVESLTALEPGLWHGPVLSGYGTHLVMVNDVLRSPPPSFDDIRGQVKEQWMAEQVDEMSSRFIDNLISRYEIVVEETEVPITVPGVAALP
jgi:hypothetical protein